MLEVGCQRCASRREKWKGSEGKWVGGKEINMGEGEGEGYYTLDGLYAKARFLYQREIVQPKLSIESIVSSRECL